MPRSQLCCTIGVVSFAVLPGSSGVPARPWRQIQFFFNTPHGWRIELFLTVGDSVADDAHLFNFSFLLQLVQITHGGSAGDPEGLTDVGIA